MEEVYSDYVVYGYREPGSGAIKERVPIGVVCPKCEAVLPEIEYGETCKCKCGWTLTRFGNELLMRLPMV